MKLDEARSIVAQQTRDYQAWQKAGAVLGKHYRDNRHLLTPVRDAAPKSVLAMTDVELDAELRRAFGGRRARDQVGSSYAPTTTAMGADPGGGVGATMVMRLDGPVTAYFIATDPETGAAALYRAADVDGEMQGQDPVRLRMGDSRDVVRDKLRVQYHQRAAGESSALKKINEANAKLWAR
jgi:hypothetical protein